GEVVPQGKVKIVQHLEGGIIEEIFVRDGDTVSAGDPLMHLDLGSGGTNIEELKVRVDNALLVNARLNAEATGDLLEFPDDVAERRPSMVATQRQTYEARISELDSSLGILRDQMRQKELEVDELSAQKKAIARNFKLAGERLELSASLLQEGLTARMEHLELEAEVESLQGELESINQSIPRAESAVAESQGRIEEAERRFRREAKEELGENQQSMNRVQELLGQANQQGVRAEIKSPADGIVQNLLYNSIGGVVRPGEAILEIVPTGEALVIEARLNPTDRGYVELDQFALVKISTYDFARYGGLDGKVISVAPDSSTDENGEPYFNVIIETDRSYLGAVEGELPITPGMQATVDIKTGTRSVVEYLIKPVLKLQHEAFRER
ncbi:MAG: HlyD family type I secretion periplasmic adaptor subunit, partial [Rhodospirillales bacterium]|nr:HlyD family type I secretion periplasmic adaptor subunit [Rhodospirillales bacterium]